MSSMPVLFVGHGSPMNAIEKTAYSDEWKNIAHTIPRPQAIVSISAHWETSGTVVSTAPVQETIYDFYGFPEELYTADYTVAGDPVRAGEVIKLLSGFDVLEDSHRGLDHGAWSVLIQMYPEKDIPVFQVSLDQRQDNAFFVELGKKLSVLREQGVLILCSGNVVHNLRQVQWSGTVLPQAETFQAIVVKALRERDIDSLLHYEKHGEASMFAVPTREHYLPFLVALGASRGTDTLMIVNDSIDLGSISMLCAVWR